MEPQTWRLILTITVIILVLLSAIITLIDSAYKNMSKAKLKLLSEEMPSRAKDISSIMEDEEEVYKTLTVGNSFTNIAAATLCSYALTKVLQMNIYLELLLSVLVIVLSILFFAEVIPELIGRRYPEKIALFAFTPTKILLVILRPFVFIVYGLSGLFLRLFGLRPEKDEPSITREELKSMMDVSVEEGVLDLQEKELIENVTEFGELVVGEVMTQRSDMVCVPDDITYDELKEIIQREKYSRIPVYRDTTDNILGILHIKDIIFLKDTDDFKVEDYMRPAFFTYEFKLISELFFEMRKTRTHFAMVLDEYGGTAGLATVEDFLEAIVGEINDEYDDAETSNIKKLSPAVFETNAATPLWEINEELHLGIDSEDVESIGGYIIELLGDFPKKGQIIHRDGFDLLVTEIEKNRVNKVRIILKDKSEK